LGQFNTRSPGPGQRAGADAGGDSSQAGDFGGPCAEGRVTTPHPSPPSLATVLHQVLEPVSFWGEARRRGPVNIHAAFIHESAIHTRKKVQ